MPCAEQTATCFQTAAGSVPTANSFDPENGLSPKTPADAAGSCWPKKPEAMLASKTRLPKESKVAIGATAAAGSCCVERTEVAKVAIGDLSFELAIEATTAADSWASTNLDDSKTDFAVHLEQHHLGLPTSFDHP